jgi:hypothetical protein
MQRVAGATSKGRSMPRGSDGGHGVPSRGNKGRGGTKGAAGTRGMTRRVAETGDPVRRMAATDVARCPEAASTTIKLIDDRDREIGNQELDILISSSRQLVLVHPTPTFHSSRG